MRSGSPLVGECCERSSCTSAALGMSFGTAKTLPSPVSSAGLLGQSLDSAFLGRIETLSGGPASPAPRRRREGSSSLG